jgi:CRP-like cAMP-binding protein
MSKAAPSRVANRLLSRLPRREHDWILRRGERVDLAFGTVLCQPDAPLSHVYFPVTATISLVMPVQGRKPLELGLIGSEGMLGATVALGINAMPLRAAVQGAGAALCLPATRFRRQLRHSPALLRRLNRHLYVLMAQLSQTAACTRFHGVEPRLARWLLETHDRAHGDRFQLTHEFLAGMLGARRSGVTIAAGDLQRRELISYSRGTIEVLDRRGLEAAACECYRAVAEDYAQAFGD